MSVHSVSLRIQVRFDKNNESVGRYVQVELMDAVGGSSARDKQMTDSDGVVNFRTVTGSHRLRITGDNVKTWEGEFDIEPSEVNHFEQVRVERRESAPDNKGPSKPVASIRLNIPGAARKQYENGTKAMEKQKWEEAIQYFQRAIAAYDKYDEAYNGLGFAETNLKNMDAARTAFAKAIELNPAYAEALRNLARIYMGEKKFAEAAPLLARSLNSEPVNGWATLNLAYADLETGKYAEAAAYARKVHDLPPEDSTGHYIAGCALNALGQHAEAVQQLQTYLQEDPQGANARAAREFLARLTAAN